MEAVRADTSGSVDSGELGFGEAPAEEPSATSSTDGTTGEAMTFSETASGVVPPGVVDVTVVAPVRPVCAPRVALAGSRLSTGGRSTP